MNRPPFKNNEHLLYFICLLFCLVSLVTHGQNWEFAGLVNNRKEFLFFSLLICILLNPYFVYHYIDLLTLCVSSSGASKRNSTQVLRTVISQWKDMIIRLVLKIIGCQLMGGSLKCLTWSMTMRTYNRFTLHPECERTGDG